MTQARTVGAAFSITQKALTVGGALVWFRRDLRDGDHAALFAALKAHAGESCAVHCAFVFDR